jgi:tetratricopeptide (TPR) repeat protein
MERSSDKGPTEDDYAGAAAVALERGDLRLALEQIGAALSFAPTNRAHRQLLDTILARTERPLDLLPSSGSAFFGAAAVRALVLARRGQVGEAVTLLFDVVRFRPSAPYLVWLAEWMSGPRGARGVRIEEVIEGTLLLCLATDRAGQSNPSDHNLESVARLISLLRRERARVPPRLWLAESMVLRRLGRTEQARRCIEQAIERTPDEAELWVELGNVLEMLGHDASASLRRATELEPERATIWLDLGNAELEEGRLRGSITDYERALELGLDSEGRAHAECGARYARALLSADTEAPFSASIHTSFGHSLERMSRRWVSELPREPDELAELITDFIHRVEQTPPSGAVRMRVDGMPICASARWLVRAALAARGVDGALAGEHDEDRGPIRLEAVDPALRTEAATLASGPFDLPSLLAVSDGPTRDVAWARASLDQFDAASAAPVSALAHHRLAVLVAVARGAQSPSDQATAYLIELAECPDTWLSCVAWTVLGGLAERSDWLRPTLWRLSETLLEDERLPAATAALLRAPGPSEEQREAWYLRARSWERARRRIDPTRVG